MAEERFQRRLAAILAADVVGYSRMMEVDEEDTLRRLQDSFREAVIPAIAENGGRLVKTTGDGLLAEFHSVVDAVRCAVTLQGRQDRRDANLPADRRLRFRIGINLGDVMVAGDDIFGDGVNVAARLEGLAEFGGVLLSGTAYDQVKKQAGLGFAFLGEQHVKNLAEPVRVYKVSLDQSQAGRAATAPQIAKPISTCTLMGIAAAVLLLVLSIGLTWIKPWVEAFDTDLPLPGKPSIAVLPFDNLSGDERLGRLADGMVTDIINNMSRFSELFVIARNSSFTYQGKPIDVRQVGRELGVRFVLEGTVAGDGDAIHVSTQLIDAETGIQQWSERYDRPLTDLFAIQSDITERVVGSIASARGAIEQAALQDARRLNPRNLDAYDLYLVGTAARLKLTRDDNINAEAILRRAVKEDPGLEPAWVQLALLFYNRIDNGWGDYASAMDQWLEAAKTATELDPNDAMAHTVLGLRYLFGLEFDRALQGFNAALDANPNHAIALAIIGDNLAWLEPPGRAVGLVERAMRLNPRNLAWVSHHSKVAYYFARQFEKSISEIHLHDDPGLWDLMFLALDYAELGQADKAREAGAKLLALRPDLSAELFLAENGEYAPAAAVNRALWLDGWRKAALPYCATTAQLQKHPAFQPFKECDQQRH